MPEASDTPPDGVLGQPSLEAVTRNRGGAIGASGFDCPYGLGVVGGRLAVADTQNRRVLLYEGVPDRDAPATLVIGQDDFGHGEENRGVGPGPATFRWPRAIAETPGGALVVADAGNHRLLGWRRSADAARGPAEVPLGPADMLVGQETFETAFEMPHVPQGPARLRFPYAVARTASGLVVADTANNRVLGFEGDRPDRGGRASWVLGQHDFGPAGETRWDRFGDDTLCWPYGLAVHGDLLAIADSGNNRVTLWRHPPLSMIALQGIAAGVAHVLTGPDHLVGVAPLAVERPGRVPGWVVGATWGVGHGLGVAVLGILGQTLMSATNVEVASVWAERLVGVLLIGLGLMALRRARGIVVHEHAHEHGPDGKHVHLHVHAEGCHAHPSPKDGHGHRHAALGVGILHGLAGGSHFWAVLPSIAMGRADAALYLGGYITASIVIMTVFGGLLGRIAARLGTGWLPRFVAAVGVVTIAVGVWWLVVTA